MASIHRFSERVIDYAERLADISDAAQRKRRGGTGPLTRWMVLPASGAALYAFARSEFFTRQAKGVLGEAKTIATGLPDDLMTAVRQTTANGANARGSSATRSSGTATSRRKSSARRRTAAKTRSSSSR
jgi:hypothetical protein